MPRRALALGSESKVLESSEERGGSNLVGSAYKDWPGPSGAEEKGKPWDAQINSHRADEGNGTIACQWTWWKLSLESHYLSLLRRELNKHRVTNLSPSFSGKNQIH